MSDTTPAVSSDTAASTASGWQQRIEGEWYGNPSVWDADGNHTGYIKVNRSSVFDEGSTTYFMHTLFDGIGPLRPRLEFVEFAFGVKDSDEDRIYMGPDFYGAGQPYGTLVDAHYYSPAWQADLRTMVHILDDGETQVYSSLLYEGPRILCVFNGIYKVAFDYETNGDTRERIDEWCASERVNGRTPFTLPAKTEGRWSGTMHAYGADQSPAGEVQVSIEHRPTSLLRANQTVTMSGLLEHSWTFDRNRSGNLHTYDGPDVWGNATSYGRALYTSQHMHGTALKIVGREFIIDSEHRLSAVWRVLDGDETVYFLFGELAFEAA